jgi:hypothetical protein
MRRRMPSGRAHPSVGRSCERLRRAAGALCRPPTRQGDDVALVARDKTVPDAAREAVSAASGRRVIAVSCDTGDDQSCGTWCLPRPGRTSTRWRASTPSTTRSSRANRRQGARVTVTRPRRMDRNAWLPGLPAHVSADYPATVASSRRPLFGIGPRRLDDCSIAAASSPHAGADLPHWPFDGRGGHVTALAGRPALPFGTGHAGRTRLPLRLPWITRGCGTSAVCGAGLSGGGDRAGRGGEDPAGR